MTTDSKAVCGLTANDIDWINRRLGAESATYLAHKMTSGLLPNEEKKLEELQAFSSRLDRLSVSAALASTAGAGAGDWVPIETAPKDGKPFLCVEYDDPETVVDVHWYRDGGAGSWRVSFGQLRRPMLWQPYPPPPGQALVVPVSPGSEAGEGEVLPRGMLARVTIDVRADGSEGTRLQFAAGSRWRNAELAVARARPAFQREWELRANCPASPPVTAEHGVEIRARVAAVLRSHMVQDSVHWWRTASLPELTDAILSALSHGGGAGRSEKGEGEEKRRVSEPATAAELAVVDRVEEGLRACSDSVRYAIRKAASDIVGLRKPRDRALEYDIMSALLRRHRQASKEAAR